MSDPKRRLTVLAISVLAAVILLAGPAAIQAAAANFLVWGQGVPNDASQQWRGVTVGVGSTIHGNVGSKGDIYLNGGGATSVDGDVWTESQFGQDAQPSDRQSER